MKILVIRRDNIGDLVCTTPLLHSLRRQMPNARIDVLATRYNCAVLAGNQDVDSVHAYTKAKHRMAGEWLAGLYARRIALIWSLRRRRFDYVLLPGGASASATRFARWIAPQQIVSQAGQHAVARGGHEVERCCELLTRMGLEYETPAVRVVANASLTMELHRRYVMAGGNVPRRLIGLHISARKPSQRWPVERFGDLIRCLSEADDQIGFLLLWAPGSADNRMHPGDDQKVATVLAASGARVFPIPTTTLEELTAALSLCDRVVCSDGGAMHLAAGLGKPIVALFGQSDVERWRPWGVPQRVLQKPSMEVCDIQVGEVVDALRQLDIEIDAEGPPQGSSKQGSAPDCEHGS